MRDKLIQIIRQAEEEFTGLIMHGKFDNPDDIPSREAMIADKLIEDGWMRPPCKVGDIVWVIYNGYVTNAEVLSLYIDKSGGMFDLRIYLKKENVIGFNSIINKDYAWDMCYRTKEEAEAELSKLQSSKESQE